MANIARVKEWVYEYLTYTDLNAEFDNIIDGVNAIDDAIPTITSFAETLLDDTSASMARTTLGIALGTGSGEYCEGDDSRLSDTRTPTASSVVPSTINYTTADASTTDINGESITITGGLFAFYPQIKASSGNTVYWGQDNAGASTGAAAWSTSTSYETVLNLSTSAGTGYVQWNYIHASPPYDLGDGDVNGFIYLKVSLDTGELVSVHMAEDPPWYGNTPNPKDKLEGMGNTPHPFRGHTKDHLILMADPMSDIVKVIFDMRRDGEDVHSLFHDGELIIGEKVDRHTPPGVDAYEIKWK